MNTNPGLWTKENARISSEFSFDPGCIFNNHSQEHSSLVLQDFVISRSIVTQLLLRYSLRFIHSESVFLTTASQYRKSGEQRPRVFLKVALQILGRKFYKNTKKSSSYSQSLLIFIHKTKVVENYSTTREIRELLKLRSTPTGITVYFYMNSSLIYILEMHRRKFQT